MSNKIELDIMGMIEGTDKCSSHSFAWDYLRHFEEIFEQFRNKPINIVEIGVSGGQSLKVWKSYFTQARIVGVDINPYCKRFADERVAIEIGSQDDPGFLARLCAAYPPTIIIDDGSHQVKHIIYTFERMFPSLLPGGIYIVEDLALHFGAQAKNYLETGEPSAADYFLRIALSSMARSVQGSGDWGTAHYTQQHVDSVAFVRSAAIVRKINERNVAAALDRADAMLQARAPDAGAFERYAQYVLRHSGPLERAETALKRAIEHCGETAGLLRSQADVCVAQRRLPQAVALATRAATLSADPFHWNLAGNLHANLGDHAAAAVAYGKAVSLAPTNPSFAYNLCDALDRSGRHAEALKAAQQGLKVAASVSPEERRLRDRIAQIAPKLMSEADAALTTAARPAAS